MAFELHKVQHKVVVLPNGQRLLQLVALDVPAQLQYLGKEDLHQCMSTVSLLAVEAVSEGLTARQKFKDVHSDIRRNHLADLEQLLVERHNPWTVVGNAEGQQGIYGSVNGLKDDNMLVAEPYFCLDGPRKAVGQLCVSESFIHDEVPTFWSPLRSSTSQFQFLSFTCLY